MTYSEEKLNAAYRMCDSWLGNDLLLAIEENLQSLDEVGKVKGFAVDLLAKCKAVKEVPETAMVQDLDWWQVHMFISKLAEGLDTWGCGGFMWLDMTTLRISSMSGDSVTFNFKI